MEYLKYRLGAKKTIIRLEVSTLKVKWLQELEWEENIVILLRFKKRHLKGYYKVAL